MAASWSTVTLRRPSEPLYARILCLELYALSNIQMHNAFAPSGLSGFAAVPVLLYC